MNNIVNNLSLDYRDSDGMPCTIEGCKLTLDKANRYWLWCEELKHNLAYKAKTREDALMIAVDSLLFTIQLKDNQLRALSRINDLALQFANEIKPDVLDEDRNY